MNKIKLTLLLLFLFLSFTSKSLSLEADVFVQSTVNRAADTLSSGLSKDDRIKELKKIEPKLTTEVLKVFDLKNSINSKKSYGGTSFENVKRMILKYRKEK